MITLADRVFFWDDGWEMLWERAYETELSLSDSFYTFYGPSYDTESPTLSSLSSKSESMSINISASSIFLAILLAYSFTYLQDSENIFYNVLIISSLKVYSFLTDIRL